MKTTDGVTLPFDAALFTIFLCSLFGANAVAMKIGFTGLGVFTSIALRFGIAILVLFIWAKWKSKPLQVNRHQLKQLTIISLVFFIQMSSFYHGQSLTTASHGTLIANLLPFIVMVLAHFFLANDKITSRKIIGLIFGFCGVAFLLFDKTSCSTSSLSGDLLIFFAVILWGCNVVYIKKIIVDYHVIQITIYPMIISVPLFFLSAIIWDNDMVIGTLSSQVVAAVLYQSLVTASFGFIMWNTLIQKYGATALHSFIFIMPVSGVFFGVLLLGEPISVNLVGAILFVSTGLIVLNHQGAKTKNRPDSPN